MLLNSRMPRRFLNLEKTLGESRPKIQQMCGMKERNAHLHDVDAALHQKGGVEGTGDEDVADGAQQLVDHGQRAAGGIIVLEIIKLCEHTVAEAGQVQFHGSGLL